MTAGLQTLIDAAQQLPPLEQLNLIRILSRSLYRSYRHVQPAEDFWKSPTFEQLVQVQQPPTITDIASLKGNFWPEDESTDDFIEYIYQQRREDSLRVY
ncbi:MAG: hypothetical protein U9R05_04610 [Chloroflexota bacterium]|nr:hypothetical protein [Chloroflexota bacterium]